MSKRAAPQDIDIIVTGGYFERRGGDDGVGSYFDLDATHTKGLLNQALGPTAAFNTVFLKDSSTFTHDDRQVICDAVKRSPLPRVVIIHGTTTLDLTARYLFQMGLNKAIVLTGTTASFARRPGEAFFNLGAAIGLVQALPFGVYGVMNGRIIPPMSLRKDPETGRFDVASGEHLLNTHSG